MSYPVSCQLIYLLLKLALIVFYCLQMKSPLLHTQLYYFYLLLASTSRYHHLPAEAEQFDTVSLQQKAGDTLMPGYTHRFKEGTIYISVGRL